MAKLYEAGHTLIDWSERKALGLTLASGCGQYASHAKLPYKVETLRDMSGSIATVKDFKLKGARRTWSELVD
jgi:hypothetical protein